MEATPTELQKHATRINAVLQDACKISDPAPLVRLTDGTITLAMSCPPMLRREVTTDLGLREIALRLPIPDTRNPRFWITMQEQWEWKSRHRVYFVQCGLRLYAGDRSEEAAQFLRLEWVAPTIEHGIQVYQGEHAGHPHWQVDRSALLGQQEYLRSLETLTAPAPRSEGEEFNGAVVLPASAQPLLDFSWLQKMHLPAQAGWMRPPSWDGRKIPGPHQSEPDSVGGLEAWWAGALKYFAVELPKLAFR